MVLRRLLRKRWVLGVVFGLSLIYFLTSTLKQVIINTVDPLCLTMPRCENAVSRDAVSYHRAGGKDHTGPHAPGGEGPGPPHPMEGPL